MVLKPLITLLAIVNPLAIVPFFIHYMTRLMGLILAALPVEGMAKGLIQLFPALAGA